MRDSYLSIFLTFLRFGLLAWGGPVAQIAMIRDELVQQKGWIAPEKFTRVLAIYQALPGPEAHELCVYFGMIRRGRIGGLLAGLGFMLPGLVFMLLLSWAYTRYGATTLLPLFVGITPAVAALIIRAAHRIGGHVLHGRSLVITALVSFALSALQVHFLLVLITCGLWQALYARGRVGAAVASLVLMCAVSVAMTWVLIPDAGPATSPQPLFVEGLRAGMLSFGGAYTVIPFLQDSMIATYPAITAQSFLDGIALSNVIPAPLVIFATYLGFLADGLVGALWMTVGIFLPAFAFTLIGHNQLEKLIENPALHGLLDGVSAGVVGLLALTALEILLHTVTNPLQGIVFLAALGALYIWKWRWAIPVMMLGCGAFGFVVHHL